MMIGRASVQFRSSGCVVCGAPTTDRDEIAEQMRIVIGNRRAHLPLYRCVRHARNTAVDRGAVTTNVGQKITA